LAEGYRKPFLFIFSFLRVDPVDADAFETGRESRGEQNG